MHVRNKTIDTCTATDSDVFPSTASSCVFASMDKDCINGESRSVF